MIYTGLSRTGEIETVKAHGGYDVAEVYGCINESNPIYYKTRTITRQPPLSYKALSNPLSDYLISGNTAQNGAPTPEATVDVVGCGEKTENLYPFPYTANLGLSGSGQNRTVNTMTYQGSSIVKLEPNTTYYMFGDRSASQDVNGVIAIFDELPKVGSVSTHFYYYNSTTQAGVEFTTDATETYGLVVHRSSADYTTDYHMMLNAGSTALPYEPYGYKLPPTVNGTEYPIYLGQVPTTRRIGCVDLSEYNFVYVPQFQIWECTTIPNIKYTSSSTELGNALAEKYINHTASGLYAAANNFAISISSVSVNTGSESISPSGKLYYALATPETGIVNEPLHKIGDYADTISMTQAGVTIPTVAGTNTLTVNTTVQPSAVSITGNIKEVSG